MPHKTKRQQQVSKIPRKKGCYISQNQVKTITEEIETVENERWLENKIVEE